MDTRVSEFRHNGGGGSLLEFHPSSPLIAEIATHSDFHTLLPNNQHHPHHHHHSHTLAHSHAHPHMAHHLVQHQHQFHHQVPVQPHPTSVHHIYHAHHHPHQFIGQSHHQPQSTASLLLPNHHQLQSQNNQPLQNAQPTMTTFAPTMCAVRSLALPLNTLSTTATSPSTNSIASSPPQRQRTGHRKATNLLFDANKNRIDRFGDDHSKRHTDYMKTELLDLDDCTVDETDECAGDDQSDTASVRTTSTNEHHQSGLPPDADIYIKQEDQEAGKIFSSKADLQLHTQLHMREAKPYKCTQCSKAFANSSYLSQHTRIHLGIKPYRCEICQRKFTQLSHLQQHIRTHTGDKPYKCRHTGCQKAFSQLSNLQSHSRCHQTDKPYKCNSCYKCFSDEPSLLEHIPKHKESKHLKTHICQYCGKSYTQETYLSKHMQKHAERTDKRPPIVAGAPGSSANGTAAASAAAAAAAATPSAAEASTGKSASTLSGIALANGTNGPTVLDHPYWPKVSPDSAASLTDVLQQSSVPSASDVTHQDFGISAAAAANNSSSGSNNNNGHSLEHHLNAHHQQQHLSQHQLQHGQHDPNGDDLAGRQATANGHNGLLSTASALSAGAAAATAVASTPYDHLPKTSTNSAFTPINAMTPHLNTLGGHTHHAQHAHHQHHHPHAAAAAAAAAHHHHHQQQQQQQHHQQQQQQHAAHHSTAQQHSLGGAQRPSYLYDSIGFPSKQSPQSAAGAGSTGVPTPGSGAFPNQLISLHQIRNYAHQPIVGPSTSLGGGGPVAVGSEHLLGVSVGSKDKG